MTGLTKMLVNLEACASIFWFVGLCGCSVDRQLTTGQHYKALKAGPPKVKKNVLLKNQALF